MLFPLVVKYNNSLYVAPTSALFEEHCVSAAFKNSKKIILLTETASTRQTSVNYKIFLIL